MSAEHGVNLLGSLPLDIHIRVQSDSGNPIVAAMADSPIASSYRAVARKTAAKLATKARYHSAAFPNIVIQNNCPEIAKLFQVIPGWIRDLVTVALY